MTAPEGHDLAEDDPIRRLIRESRTAIQQAAVEREAAQRRELEHAQQRVKILQRSAVALGVLLVWLVGVALYALHQRSQAQTFAAVAKSNMEIAAENEKKAVKSEAKARQSEAKAKQKTVDVLVDLGAGDIEQGSLSEALTHFAKALALQPDSPSDHAFNRQRLGFLWRKVPRLKAIVEHDGPVHTVLFSSDGTLVLSAGLDRLVRVSDAHSGQAIAALKGHTGSVYHADFSPDGSRIVSASKDGTARVWDSRSSKIIAELKGHRAPVFCAHFSPDGTRVVTASEDRTARVWEAGTGKTIAVLEGHTATVFSAVFSPDGSRILTASADRTARVWDAASGRVVAVLKGHSDVVKSALFSPDGTRVVTASFDRTAKVWDPASGKILVDLKGHKDFVLTRRLQSRWCSNRHGVSGCHCAFMGNDFGQKPQSARRSCRYCHLGQVQSRRPIRHHCIGGLHGPPLGRPVGQVLCASHGTQIERSGCEFQSRWHSPGHGLTRWRRTNLGDRSAHLRHSAHRSSGRGPVRRVPLRWCALS